MDFEEMLELARAGGDAMPEDIFDQLATNYQATVQGSQESLAQRDSRIKDQEQENLKLKALAFERMLNNGSDNIDTDDDPPAVDEPRGIDSLFTRTTRIR